MGSGNALVDYSRAPCLGADQKARGLWERDCGVSRRDKKLSTLIPLWPTFVLFSCINLHNDYLNA